MSENMLADPSKSLQRYLELESILHIFFEGTNYCRESFGQTCQGCCHKNLIEISKYQKECKELERERSRIYGEGDSTRDCPYSSDKGCILETHKAPICIAYTCPPLTKEIKEQGIEYNWFEVQALLINVLNDTNSDWLDESELAAYCISDEEFSKIKKELEDSLKPKITSTSKP
jgi:hypothetical protein